LAKTGVAAELLALVSQDMGYGAAADIFESFSVVLLVNGKSNALSA